MVEIRLHEEIDSARNAWFYRWMGMDEPFSLETLQRIMDENPNKGLKINIHCVGGSVPEGFAIYDALRSSGRTISCNVEGDCHSMAIAILLAAPKDRRTAAPNSHFLIHEVSGGVQGNTTAVTRYAEEMQEMQNRMLDIYADRTGWDRAELETIMKEEKMRDAEFMLAHGFIGAINQYNTNKKTDMGIIDKFKNFLSQIEKEENEASAPENVAPENVATPENAPAPENKEEIDFNARITELETMANEARAQVEALTAERDELTNKNVEADGKIADLTEQVNALTEQNEALTNEVAGLNEQNAAKDNEIHDLKEQLGSHYVPADRLNGQPASDGKSNDKSSEERKNEIREALARNKKK